MIQYKRRDVTEPVVDLSRIEGAGVIHEGHTVASLLKVTHVTLKMKKRSPIGRHPKE
jgi:hypothetical protein